MNYAGEGTASYYYFHKKHLEISPECARIVPFRSNGVSWQRGRSPSYK